MESFIEELKKIDNKLIVSEADGIQMFKNLNHNKSGLDAFLKNTVAEVLTSTKKRLVCTSNEQLVKKFSAIKEEGATLQRTMRAPFETSRNHNALTWDLIKNKYASIAGNSWQILNFIVIKEDNIEMLHSAINELLRKKQ